MVCRDVDKGDLAEKYLNGQLDPATQDDFELHILECLDCQHFLEALQAARDDLASHADEVRSHSSFTRGRLQWAWVGAAALSVIALSLGITRFALHHRGRPQVAQQKPPAPNLPESMIEVNPEVAVELTQSAPSSTSSTRSFISMMPIGGANRGARTRRNKISVDGADARDNSVNGIRATATQEATQEFQPMRKPDNAQPDLQALADLPLNARSPASVVSPSGGEPTDTGVLARRMDNLPTNGRDYLRFTLKESQVTHDSAPSIGKAPKSLAKGANAKTRQPASSKHATAVPSRSDKKSSSIAPPQVDHPLIKNKSDAPVQITEAFCGQNERGNYCHATLQFAADTKETWDGYGLLWIVTYEDGSKNPLRQAFDRSIAPTGRPDGSYVPSGGFFKPGEVVGKRKEGNAAYEGVGFGMKDHDGKTLRITVVEVEVEFVINTNGTVWGDSKAPILKNMLEQRKQAKEGAKEGTQ